MPGFFKENPRIVPNYRQFWIGEAYYQKKDFARTK